MSRLFITPRELNFISDIAKELIKDVCGQRVVYYPISESKTKVHGVYNESQEKVFDRPILLDALVDARFQDDTKIDTFGVDRKYRLEVYIQYRDLVEKGIEVSVGDFFSYSDVFYEITEYAVMRNVYGHAEHKEGVKLIGTKAREGQFNAPVQGPTDIKYVDPDSVQKTFEQQRGRAENREGQTGDVRDLVKAGVLEQSLEGTREVSERGAAADDSRHGSSFYDE